jgi:MbtH protein
MSDEHDDRSHIALVNDEEQYSLWPAARPVPDGWRPSGEPGSREACLARISELWVDMRPRSLRERMAAGSAAEATGAGGTQPS